MKLRFHSDIELSNGNNIRQHRSHLAGASRFSVTSFLAGVALEIIHPGKKMG